MDKFFKVYNNIEEKALVTSLVITVILTFSQVVMRTIFNYSLSWSEELVRYIFIWQVWLGLSIGERYHKHIKVDVICNFVKGKSMRVINIIANSLSLVVCIFLVWFGMVMVMNLMEKSTLSAAMRIPLWIVYFSLPFSALMTGIRYSLELKDQIKTVNIPEQEMEGVK